MSSKIFLIGGNFFWLGGREFMPCPEEGEEEAREPEIKNGNPASPERVPTIGEDPKIWDV